MSAAAETLRASATRPESETLPASAMRWEEGEIEA